MKFDRKLALIAPSIVLVCVIVGVLAAALQLRVLRSVSETWKERSDFIASVENGQKILTQRQAVDLLRFSLEVESRRTSAIQATYELLLILAVMGSAASVVLMLGIRAVPREHWPRFGG